MRALVGVVGDFGVKPEYRRPLEQGGMRVSGLGDDGEIRGYADAVRASGS